MELTDEKYDELKQAVVANGVMISTLLAALRGRDLIEDVTIDTIEATVLQSAQSFDMPYMVNQCQMVMDLTRPVIESLKNEGHIE